MQFIYRVRQARSAWLLIPLAILIGSGCCIARGQTEAKVKTSVSGDPLTSEQLAVYRGAVTAWFDKDKSATNLAEITDPIEESELGYDKKCVAGLNLEPLGPNRVHRFRVEDLAQLGSKNFRLVDPNRQKKEVDDNDPGTALQSGKSVDEAVSNGFKHALFTFGEVRFNKQHTLAVVSFSFVCGSLCGNGSTMVMRKQPDGEWKRIRSCGGWVS